jgi:integrase/recombinase XerD
MENAIRRFLAYLELDCRATANTILAYKTDLSQFRAFLGSRQESIAPIDALQIVNLKNYRTWLEGRGYAPSTIARKLASMRSFMNFMNEWESIECQQSLNALQAPSQPRHRPRVLEESEVHAIFDEVKAAQTTRSLRDWAILALLESTGMRASEIVALRLSDFDLDRDFVSRPPQRASEIPLGASAEVVQNYIENGRPNLLRDSQEDSCFLNLRGQALTRQGLWLVVKNWARAAGVNGDISPHTFRHSVAKKWLQAGKSHQEVQHLLGLSSPNTLRIHLQLNGTSED